jgi:hypothetical protein
MSKFIPFLLAIALFVSSCDKKTSTTTTRADSNAIVTEIQDTSGAEGPMDHVPGSTEPGPSDNDGSTPDPVRNPPDDKPAPQPPGGPAISGNITVQSPMPNDYVNADQFYISGLARTFESNVAYRVRDLASGQVLAQGHTTATGEMGQFSPYRITVTPKKGAGIQYPTRALIEVFENSAKDGTEINKVQVPVKIGIGADEPNAIEVFFSNAKKGSNTDCSKVFSLPRSIPETKALATIAIQRLLAGPTASERTLGYASQIPAGTKLNKIVITGGVARADFSSELATAAGACRVTAIRSQIERTLKQFSTVKSVVITANAKSDVLQP